MLTWFRDKCGHCGHWRSLHRFLAGACVLCDCSRFEEPSKE